MEATWNWLAEQPAEAAELAQLLYEAAPRLKMAASRASSLSTARSRSLRSPQARRASFGTSMKDCIANAQPMAIGEGSLSFFLCPTCLCKEREKDLLAPHGNSRQPAVIVLRREL